MNKKKGFALYELLITYSLAFIVISSIFSTIATLSTKLAKLYKEDSIMANQLLVFRSIGNDFAYYSINNISKCMDGENQINNCIEISYENTNVSPFTKTLILGNDFITYGDVKTEFKYGNVDISSANITSIDTNYDKDFLRKIIKLYIPISYEGKNYNITLFCTNGINESITYTRLFSDPV